MLNFRVKNGNKVKRLPSNFIVKGLLWQVLRWWIKVSVREMTSWHKIFNLFTIWHKENYKSIDFKKKLTIDYHQTNLIPQYYYLQHIHTFTFIQKISKACITIYSRHKEIYKNTNHKLTTLKSFPLQFTIYKIPFSFDTYKLQHLNNLYCTNEIYMAGFPIQTYFSFLQNSKQ